MTSVEFSQSCCISPTSVVGGQETTQDVSSSTQKNFCNTERSSPFHQAKQCLKNFSKLMSSEEINAFDVGRTQTTEEFSKQSECASEAFETASTETKDVFNDADKCENSSAKRASSQDLNNFNTSGSSLDDFMAFLGETHSSPSQKRKKVTHLPGFLFPDGKPQAIEPEDEAEATSASAGTETSSITLCFGTSEQECQRLTSKYFGNSFEVFSLPVSASEADIRRAFKKLSLIVHPDKCNHEKAKEAFDVVSKAYEDLQRPAMKEKYRSVYAEAKKRVLTELNAQNKIRAKAKETLLQTDDDSIQDAVGAMCEKMIIEMQENAEYAEKCRKANAEWEKQMGEELEREAQKEREVKRRWDETREARVEDWRDFKEDVEHKRIKVECFRPVIHQREQRKASDKKPNSTSRARGIDESYKQNWR